MADRKGAIETVRRMLHEGARLDGEADPALWTHAETALDSLTEVEQSLRRELERLLRDAIREAELVVDAFPSGTAVALEKRLREMLRLVSNQESPPASSPAKRSS